MAALTDDIFDRLASRMWRRRDRNTVISEAEESLRHVLADIDEVDLVIVRKADLEEAARHLDLLYACLRGTKPFQEVGQCADRLRRAMED